MRAVFAAIATVLVVLSASAVLAQTEPRKSPLGVAVPSAAPPAAAPATRGGLSAATHWLFEIQRDLHQRLAGAVRAIGADNPVNATLFLMALSFAYGVFHAAGPGHGKAVIASYVVANERTVRRGVQLSFLAALFQALSALVLVGALGLLFNVTGLKRRIAEAWIETASWGLVALVGAWLLYSQIRRIIGERAAARHESTHAHSHDHNHGHDHAHHGHAHHGHHAGHDACCDHAHLPPPQQLEGAWSWRKASTMAFAVGIRPCTGAIVVLVFAVSQGLLWAGILSTFAMALGTAITVSLLAAFAIGSRELAVRIAGRRNGPWAAHVRNAAGVMGAFAVLAMGVLFFTASLAAPAPF